MIRANKFFGKTGKRYYYLINQQLQARCITKLDNIITHRHTCCRKLTNGGLQVFQMLKGDVLKINFSAKKQPDLQILIMLKKVCILQFTFPAPASHK